MVPYTNIFFTVFFFTNMALFCLFEILIISLPQGLLNLAAIFWQYSTSNNISCINFFHWFISPVNFNRLEIPFERNLLKSSKKASHPFFYTAHNVLLTPLPFQFYSLFNFFFFPLSTILSFSLLNVFIPSSTIFIIFPPQCFDSPSPPPLPHLFYIFFHPQIHRPPSDSTSTPRWWYIVSLFTKQC